MIQRYVTTAVIFVCSAVNAAVQQPIVPKPGASSTKPVRVVNIRFGASAGMCYGYCSSELEVRSGEAVLHQHAWGPVEQRRYPARQVRADLSNKHWKELQQLVNHDGFMSLPATIGCPDCTDGGAESVEVKFSDHTSKKITFDMGNPPKQLKDLRDKLWELEQKLGKELPN
jgi:hypothetical protein